MEYITRIYRSVFFSSLLGSTIPAAFEVTTGNPFKLNQSTLRVEAPYYSLPTSKVKLEELTARRMYFTTSKNIPDQHSADILVFFLGER